MPKTTLKDLTERLGISLNDIVTYHKKGAKAVIEIQLKANGPQNAKKGEVGVFSNILTMAENVGIKDWSLNHDHYLYGTPKRNRNKENG